MVRSAYERLERREEGLVWLARGQEARVIPASGGDQLTGRVHLPGSGGKSSVLSLPAFTHGFLPSRKQTAFPGRLSSRKGETGEENLVLPSVSSSERTVFKK